MDDNWRIVLLAFIAMLTANVPVFIQGYLNRKAAKSEIAEVHTAVNSKMDSLLVAAKGQAQAEGELKGAADEQARTATPREQI